MSYERIFEIERKQMKIRKIVAWEVKSQIYYFAEIPKRLKGAVLKTARRVTLVRGFKSHSPRQICSCSSVGRAPDF